MEIISAQIHNIKKITTTATLETKEILISSQTVELFDPDDVLAFRGYVYSKKYSGPVKTYELIGYDKELNEKRSGSYTSKAAKDIIKGILDGDMDACGTAEIPACTYLYYTPASIDSDLTTVMTVEFYEKSIKEMFDAIADRIDADWCVQPDGLVCFLKLINAINQAIFSYEDQNIENEPQVEEIVAEVNVVKLYGAIVNNIRLVTTEPYGMDQESIQLHGRVYYVDYFPFIHDLDELNNLSDAILNRTGFADNPRSIKNMVTYDFLDLIKTVTYSFTPITELVTPTDYYLISDEYDIKNGSHEILISTGVVKPERSFGQAEGIKIETADDQQIQNITGIIMPDLMKWVFLTGADASDFTGLFTDNTWHTLDISSKVPIGAKSVIVFFEGNGGAATTQVYLRKNATDTMVWYSNQPAASIYTQLEAVMAISSTRTIDYKFQTVGTGQGKVIAYSYEG